MSTYAERVAAVEARNVPGWPRTRMKSSRHGVIPAPWVARVVYDKGSAVIDPARFALERLETLEKGWLCQVCGQGCGVVMWAPVAPDDFRLSVDHEFENAAGRDVYEVSGGPVCSMRCVRLALVFCPHFDPSDSRVIRFGREGSSFGHPCEGLGGLAIVVHAWIVEADTPTHQIDAQR